MAISTIKKLNKSRATHLCGCSTLEIGTTSTKQITLNESMEHFALLHFNTSYYKNGAPNYGGLTISTVQFKGFTGEAVSVCKFDNEYRFKVYWVNATTIGVSCVDSGSGNSNHCLCVRGIL